MRNVTFGRDNSGTSWHSWLSFQDDLFTFFFGISLSLSVGFNSVQELLSTSRVFDVFNSQVNSLFNVSVTNNLVDNNTNRRFGDVVNNTGFTVVVFVWHTFLDRTVGFDVNDITDLVSLQVGG